MNAAAWGADDFEAGLREAFGCVNEALDQVRHSLRASANELRHDMRASADELRHGMRASAGGSWAGGERRRTSARPGKGHWGGGFVGGPWGACWPGGPGPGPAGPPGSARGPKASRGDVRAALLALLQECPRKGYQIMSEIEERSGGAWRPSPGAVYPALQQLADEGLISGEESEGRRTFTLTDAGRDYIRDHPERARGAWESAEQQEAWEVPGLFAEAARLGGGIVQIAHAGTHEQILAAERLLERTRREIYRILAEDDEEPTGQDS
ncbi:MAG: PadR family transcriptional regulator [Streptosporangiaceae bacterium]